MSETVTVYSTPGCVQCTATTKKLDVTGITYTLVDLTKDDNALEHVKGLGYIQAPVVETSSTSCAGFRPVLITALARILKLG